MTRHSRTFYLYSLGCPKNLVDSEWLSGGLIRAGWKGVSHAGEAEVIIVNTCAFITPAVQESIDAILALHQEAPDAKMVVTGCLPLRYGRQLRALLPEVTIFFLSRQMETLGPEAIESFLKGEGWMIHAPRRQDGELPSRQISTSFYTAYVKIADGCNRRCAFCTLPRIRGRYRSRPLEAVEREVRWLVSRGVREMILVAQDTAAYGQDLPGKVTLAGLLERLAAIPGLPWIKLLYLYPDDRRIDTSLIEVLRCYENICPVVDIPVQHASARVLKAMRRPGPATLRKILKRLLEIPGFHLRTTVMVGFPGETKRDFRELCAFVEEGWFDNLGVFTYWDEEGTAASHIPDKIPEEEKQHRKEILMEIQQKISMEKNKGRIGRIFPVLVEGVHEETDLLLRGRTEFQFPEIDGCVLITGGYAEVGEIVPVKITNAGAYDLVGEIWKERPPDRGDLARI